MFLSLQLSNVKSQANIMYQENVYYLPKHETDNRPTYPLYLGLSSAPPTLLSTVLKNVGDYYTEHYHLKQTNKKRLV